MDKTNGSGVEAFKCTFDKLFHQKPCDDDGRQLTYPIKIDTYQRDYVWLEDKVKQLIQDVISHEDKIPYYLGSLLFHEKKEDDGALYIIDGQQRITTLAILYYISRKKKVSGLELCFESSTSQANIRRIYNAISDDENLENNARQVTDKLDQIEVTVIITESQDQAFRFFDSQNTRGVRLSATDLLKSYHLRAISGNIRVQEDAAKSWESLQSRETVLIKDAKKDPAFELFNRILWRIRNWSRGHFVFEQWETVLDEFEGNRDGEGQVTIFPGPKNRNFCAMSINGGNQLELKRSSFLFSDKSKNLPFLIQQPLYDGYFFFLYAEKYSELLMELQEESSEEKKTKEKHAIHSFITASGNTVSPYLKGLLVNLALAYTDRFGKDERYSNFLSLLMLWFLQCRLDRYAIKKRSPFTMMRDNMNVFGLIEISYDSQDLMERFRERLIRQAKGKDPVQVHDGVRTRYKEFVEENLPEYCCWDSIENDGDELYWEQLYREF